MSIFLRSARFNLYYAGVNLWVQKQSDGRKFKSVRRAFKAAQNLNFGSLDVVVVGENNQEEQVLLADAFWLPGSRKKNKYVADPGLSRKGKG